jgi:hypothetical protein
LQRSLDLSDEEGATVDGLPLPTLSVGTEDPLQGSVTSMELADTVEQMQFTAAGTSGFLEEGVREEELDSLDRLGPVSPEVAKYIQQLQSKLLSTQKDLDDCKHSLTALEMEGMVGEEQNDLLDYLRSLEPDKVCKLSNSFLPTLYNTGYM